MSWLFDNAVFQQAVVAFVVLLLAAAGNWVKSKSSRASLVNEWWVYIHPVVDSAVAELKAKLDRTGVVSAADVSHIIQTALVTFTDEYRDHEPGEPSSALLSAVTNELENAIKRITK